MGMLTVDRKAFLLARNILYMERCALQDRSPMMAGWLSCITVRTMLIIFAAVLLLLEPCVDAKSSVVPSFYATYSYARTCAPRGRVFEIGMHCHIFMLADFVSWKLMANSLRWNA
jgi:hypothetical protein